MVTAREEAEIVLFGVVKEVLEKTGLLSFLLLLQQHTVTAAVGRGQGA